MKRDILNIFKGKQYMKQILLAKLIDKFKKVSKRKFARIIARKIIMARLVYYNKKLPVMTKEW